MAKEKPGSLQIKSFADHHVITQPNPLRKVLLRVPESDLDDPVGARRKGACGTIRRIQELDDDRGRPALGRACGHSP